LLNVSWQKTDTTTRRTCSFYWRVTVPRKSSLKSKSKKAKPEKEIQAEILKYLETTDLLFWRQNSGLLPIPTGRKTKLGKPVFRMVKLGTEGLPDIIAVLPPSGRFLGLEVKSETGKLRPAQQEFAQKLLASG
jgi:hypothetical protein